MERLEKLSSERAALTALLPIKTALGAIPTLALTPNEAGTLQRGQRLLIRPHQSALAGIPLIFAEYDGVPVALVEAVQGEFRVLRGFHF
jgi:tRNA pseudouridine55 synthase